MLQTAGRHRHHHQLGQLEQQQQPRCSPPFFALFNFNSTMPLFGKKSKLQSAICDAAVDVLAYTKVYKAFQKHENGPSEALNFVLYTISEKEQSNEGKIFSRHKSSKSSGNGKGSLKRSVAFLTVLHGIVMSFPRDMEPLLEDKSTCDLLLSTITSFEIPVTVRETLLSMCSTWCILFQESLRVRMHLETVVNSAKEKANLKPSFSLIPRPATTLKQEGWNYPSDNNYYATDVYAIYPGRPYNSSRPPPSHPVSVPDMNHHYHSQNTNNMPSAPNANYNSPYTSSYSQNTSSYQTTDDDPVVSAQKQALAHSNTYLPRRQSSRRHYSSHTYNNNSHDQQQHQYLNGFVDPVIYSQEQALEQARQYNSNGNTRNRERTDSYLSTSSELSPGFLEHVEKSAQELKSLCDMLSENLISLNVEESPETNQVVKEMMEDIESRKSGVENFMTIVIDEHPETKKKLADASEEVKRTLRLYDNTVVSHNEWKAVQESLKTSELESKYRDQAESSKTAANVMAGVSSSSSPLENATSRTESDGQNIVSTLVSSTSSSNHALSSKAKGKMAEVTY